ncbi:hypothetical protein SynA18461_01988 [Synechococcus sp. A18-46.1]|nr:hypothetical protein SynA18461_01988 [Synechococcus sp. A18-46.1]
MRACGDPKSTTNAGHGVYPMQGLIRFSTPGPHPSARTWLQS